MRDQPGESLAGRVQTFYAEAGALCSGELRCDKCGVNQGKCSAKDAAYYLRYGWPIHCGQTMTLVKSNV